MVSGKSQYTPAQYLSGILRHDLAVLARIDAVYKPGIIRLVRQNHGTRQDGEDVFQDGMEAVFRKVKYEDLKDLSCSFNTFLFEICKRIWLNKLRKEKHQSGLTPEGLMVFTDEEDPQQALEATERHALFWEKFLLLGDDCRKVLELTLTARKKAEEVAGIMGYASAEYARQKKFDCKEQWKRFIKADPRFEELRTKQKRS